MDVQVTHREQGGCSVVDVDGELDLYTAPTLRTRLGDLVSEGRHGLVVDLRRVAFMDSAGLGALVDGFKRARSSGGTMALVCTDERILRLLRITGLTGVMPVHPHLAEALVACAGAAPPG